MVKRVKGHRVSTCIQLILCLAMLYTINLLWFSKEVAIRQKKHAESMLAQAEAKLKELKWISDEKLANQTRTIEALKLMQVRAQENLSGKKVEEMIPKPFFKSQLSRKAADPLREIVNASGTRSAASGNGKQGPPGLPEVCSKCRAGGDDGGVPLDKDGVCRHFCSMGRYCGTSAAYQSTDCRQPCNGSACKWQLGTPQTNADAFWIANGIIPFDRGSRRFDFAASECKRRRGVDPQHAAIWIDVGAHNSALEPDNGLVIAFEPQLWLWEKVVQQSQKNPCVFPIPAACAPGAPTFRTFHTSANYHSSSLLSVDAKAAEQFGTWKGSVSQSHELEGAIDFSVLTLSLEEVITRLPPCRRVDFLKIDAQGFDLSVAQSAGSWIRVVNEVEIETPGPDATPLYTGAPTKSDILAWFAEQGFEKTREETACCQGKTVEQNVFLRNVRFPDLVVSDLCPHPSGRCEPVPRAACPS